MSDITSTHLEAAIIDQKVAGAFHDKVYAFVAVYENAAWRLGIAVANEQGYNPIGGKTFKDRSEADEWAKVSNQHIGRDEESVMSITMSTMGGRRVELVEADE